MKSLSIIIPFGLSKERAYIEERIRQKAKFYQDFKGIECIFIEGFSSKNSDSLKNYIEKKGHSYLKDQKQQKNGFFSQGQCRNLGASFANSQVIMFLDADCHLSYESLKKILKLLKLKNLAKNPNELLVLPCIYLNEKAHEFLSTKEPEKWDLIIQNDLISGQRKWIKYFSLSSSIMAMNKHKFLELGGFDEAFVGHGYEDFDLMARALNSCIYFEKMPFNLSYDSRNWEFSEFKGFRALFSLLGYESAFYGLYAYHFWHIEPNQNKYFDNKDKNHRFFYQKLKNYNEKQKKQKSFYPLQSLVYKPYIYELKHKSIFKFYLLQSLQSKLSHSKFYRLFVKLIHNPKGFFKDSKNPLIQKLYKKK